ncbi:MAG: PilZ domain-containing protein [Deltaproteobacteria bacterium]|jgi:hypothetical protein|nr:PilZ domain-containing protein [Deltaproteobacteria bacterium]MBT6491133.1 PilZ domain-containing protein [Deltaproteobacteria bacterium]
MSERRQNSRRDNVGKHGGPNRRTPKERRGSERREHTRVSLELWMEELVGDDVYFRRTGNLSAGGVFFDSAIPHQLGTEMTLKFTLPGCKEMVVARGKVVSHTEAKTDGLGMGVKFISFEGNGKDKLKTYIRAL